MKQIYIEQKNRHLLVIYFIIKKFIDIKDDE